MIIQSLLLLLPLGIWAWIIIEPRSTSRGITATFLGFVWAFHASLILNIVLLNTSSLAFTLHDNLFYGVPLDWNISLAIITGALGPLSRTWPLSTVLRLLLQTGLVTLVYTVGSVEVDMITTVWVVLFASFTVAIPAMYLADWTATDTHIGKRAFLQSLAWAVLLFWLFPSLIFHLTADNWYVLLQRDATTTGLYLLPLILPAYLLISALYQFAVQGEGTAFPYDPPKRLVTQGVYQYISNPMQLGISLAMGWWGVVIQSLWVSISAAIAVALFVVFRDVCNGSCAIGLNNPEWEEYQRSIPKWFPRRKL